MSSRYIADRFLPDKAIDLVDEAASRVRLKAFTAPPNLKEMENEIKRLQEEKASAVRSQDFENAAKIRDKEKELQILLDEEKEKWKNSSSHDVKEISTEDIAMSSVDISLTSWDELFFHFSFSSSRSI